MEKQPEEQRALIEEMRLAHVAEISQLKQSHDNERTKLFKTIARLKAYGDGKQNISELRDALEKERRKNEALEARVANYEKRFDAIHDLCSKNMRAEVPSDVYKAEDDSDSEEPSDAHSEAKENAHEDKDTEVERELPFSFTQNKLATPMKNVSEERKTIESDADAEPCEPGLNSEEFMQFLKRRREERREECMNPPDYKYVDVVRHKKIRAQMDPYECPDCKAFYESFDGKKPMLPCHHQCKTPDKLGDRLRKMGGRHRARYKPPRTPPGFWDLDFPDSIERKKKAAAEAKNNKKESAG